MFTSLQAAQAHQAPNQLQQSQPQVNANLLEQLNQLRFAHSEQQQKQQAAQQARDQQQIAQYRQQLLQQQAQQQQVSAQI